MCRGYEKIREKAGDAGFFLMLKSDYQKSGWQILRLLLRYWAILLLFLPVLFMTGKAAPDLGKIIGHILCVDNSYNGAFWYVSEYILMLLLLPLLDLLLVRIPKEKRRGKLIFFGILFALLFIWALAALFNPDIRTWSMGAVKAMRPAFLLVMGMGYLIAKGEVFEKLDQFWSRKKPVFSVTAGVLLMAVAVSVRILLSDSPAYAGTDFLLVPVLICGFCRVTAVAPGLEKVFCFFGRISAYMWLTHLFVYSLTMDPVLEAGSSHLFFYLAELLLDVVLCLVLSFIPAKIRKKS